MAEATIHFPATEEQEKKFNSLVHGLYECIGERVGIKEDNLKHAFCDFLNQKSPAEVFDEIDEEYRGSYEKKKKKKGEKMPKHKKSQQEIVRLTGIPKSNLSRFRNRRKIDYSRRAERFSPADIQRIVAVYSMEEDCGHLLPSENDFDLEEELQYANDPYEMLREYVQNLSMKPDEIIQFWSCVDKLVALKTGSE